VWGGDETLLVISSDLSHYLPYTTAQRVDGETVQSILELRLPIAHDHACGGTPISGLIVAAQKHHLTPIYSICETLATPPGLMHRWWVMPRLLLPRRPIPERRKFSGETEHVR